MSELGGWAAKCGSSLLGCTIMIFGYPLPFIRCAEGVWEIELELELKEERQKCFPVVGVETLFDPSSMPRLFVCQGRGAFFRSS